MGFQQNHAGHTTLQVNRVVDPTDYMKQMLAENEQLKADNINLKSQITEAIQAIQNMQAEMKGYRQFKQILDNPIEKFSVELYDNELLRQIRGRMVEMFGRGGHMDAEGHWAETIVNQRFQIVLRQLLLQGMKHWHRVKPQIDEIIKTQGLMK